MKVDKIFWKVYGFEISFWFIFVLILIGFWPFLFNSIMNVQNEFNNYQQGINVVDIETASAEELEQFDNDLSKIGNLTIALNKIFLLLLVISLLISLNGAIFNSFQNKLFLNESKVKKTKLKKNNWISKIKNLFNSIINKEKVQISYWNLFIKWLGINVLLILFTIIYFFLAVFIVSFLGLVESNSVITIVFWLYFILLSYKIFSSFVLMNGNSIKESIKFALLKHSLFVIVGIIYFILLKKLVELSYSFNMFKIIMLVFFIFYFLFGIGIIAFEKILISKI